MKREAVEANVQVVDQDADPALERRGRADHALSLVKHDPRRRRECVLRRTLQVIGEQAG
jgi:hypothetical protein